METKVKTTVTISAKVLEKTDVFAKRYKNRSEFVEMALRELIVKLEKKQSEEQNPENQNRQKKRKLSRREEIKILNRIAKEQGREILENLEFQADL